MNRYRYTVIRKEQWIFDDIEAETEEDAKRLADDLALLEPPHDGWAYDTTAKEMP